MLGYIFYIKLEMIHWLSKNILKLKVSLWHIPTEMSRAMYCTGLERSVSVFARRSLSSYAVWTNAESMKNVKDGKTSIRFLLGATFM